MAKYYVQSGTMRSIVEAETSRKAALWAVHQAMQQVLPMDEQEQGGPHVRDSDPLRERPLAVLSGKLRVSSCGFDRGDAMEMVTLEVVGEWNQMVTTLNRLERMLYRAA